MSETEVTDSPNQIDLRFTEGTRTYRLSLNKKGEVGGHLHTSEVATVSVLMLNQTGTEIVKALVTAASQAAGTYQAVWDGTDDNGSTVADDTYWIIVLAADAAYNWGHAIDQAVVNTTGGPTVSAYPSTISPNGDGINDTTTITYSLDQAATVLYLVVLNEDGTEIVKMLAGPGSKAAGTYQATWNGTDTLGAVVPDGSYWVVVLAQDASGTWGFALCQVTVDTS